MAHCRPNCEPHGVDYFPRDFLWMTLNIIDYLIGRCQYMEAQRILEEISYCGGFCKNLKNQCVAVTSQESRADALKDKVLEMYCKYIRRLNKGYKDDYRNIMNIINYLSILPTEDRKIYEYLINIKHVK